MQIGTAYSKDLEPGYEDDSIRGLKDMIMKAPV